MSFEIINKDITKLDVDAIVNAANTSLQRGGGVCGAIFKAAGAEKLEEACNKFAPISTGDTVITDGFDLKAKYIIHTAGPVYNPVNPKKSEELLAKSYKNSLKLAKEYELQSLAFPLISAGIYGYPKSEALAIAQNIIEDFLSNNQMDIYLTILDEELLAEIK